MVSKFKSGRRSFLWTGLGLGAASTLTTLGSSLAFAKPNSGAQAQMGNASPGVLKQLHHPAKAKRIIYLTMSGAPSQMETFDYKPVLNQMHEQELPDSVRKGQRLTGMSANQARLPIAGSAFAFHQAGQSGAWVSELLPHTKKVVDELCIIRSMYTEAINHDPARTFLQTGSQLSGRPSIGAWLSYGLGSNTDKLPASCVLVSKNKSGQPLFARLWGNGFLPAAHQGVQFRSGKDPVLYLSNPDGVSDASRRKMLDRLRQVHELEMRRSADPAIAARLQARIKQYEMAYNMQFSVPDVADLASEPKHVQKLYGPDVLDRGSFASNCLLARRLIERGVRYVQLFHQGWDQHENLPRDIQKQCKETDQACAGLIQDLKQRGMLEDTLVIWGGEFGRTSYCQGKLTKDNYGRDHHPRCFSMWMAGGGTKAGLVYGRTDDFSYNILENPVHIHDLHATILHLLGIDHERLTYRFQGRDFRLTDVHGIVKHDLIA